MPGQSQAKAPLKMAKNGTLKFWDPPTSHKQETLWILLSTSTARPRFSARSNSEKSKNLKLLKLELCKEQICLNCQNPGEN